MAHDKLWTRGLIADMPEDHDSWRKFGFGLMLIAGALAFGVWAPVHAHPEQDLPLWPAWIFAGLAFIGFVLMIASGFELGPFRAGRTQRHH